MSVSQVPYVISKDHSWSITRGLGLTFSGGSWPGVFIVAHKTCLQAL
jgi:hypothetical protein